MILKALTILLSIALSGCTIFAEDDVTVENYDNDNSSKTALRGTSTQGKDPLQSSLLFKKQFNNNAEKEQTPASVEKQETLQPVQQNIINSSQQNQYLTKHNINYYARGIMQDLVANLQHVNSTTPVAVTSFVMLDSNYNESNILGIQLAESLIHEVHKFGIPVIDFKTTGFIRVTEQGDFAFSKDYEDLTDNMPALYIVSGTMLKNTDGYLVNARIVGIKSQAVVASAQSLIPNHVVDPILMMAITPKSQSSNESVELTRVTYTNGFNSAMDTSKEQNIISQDQSKPKNAYNSSTNKVSLIQE